MKTIELGSRVRFVDTSEFKSIPIGAYGTIINNYSFCHNDYVVKTDLKYLDHDVLCNTFVVKASAVIHADDYKESANKEVEYARASVQYSLNEFLPVLETAKQFIEGKTHSNAFSLHKKFVDLLSSMHILECEIVHLSTLKE